jgi:hypothetical protein
MDETLFTIIRYVIGILGLIVFRYVIPYAKLKLEKSKYADVLDYIEKCMNAAESNPIFKEIVKAGEQKKQFVIESVTKYINEKGIKITSEQLDILIQALFTELDGDTLNVK